MIKQNKHTKLSYVYKTRRKTPHCITILLSCLWTGSFVLIMIIQIPEEEAMMAERRTSLID